jgi:hypothetical protein
MNIPTLPTDNFYKFISLAGITITLAAVFLVTSMYDSINKEIDEIKIDNIKLTDEMDNIQVDIKIIKNEQLELSRSLGKYDSLVNDPFSVEQFLSDIDAIKNDKNYREYLEFWFKYRHFVIPEIAVHKLIKEKMKQQEIIRRKAILNGNLILIHIDIMERKLYELIVICVISSLLVYFGLNIAYRGFSQWYSLVQEPSDKKLALEVQELKAKKKNNKDSK